jgi:SET and MYND domain-containing protein 4
MELKSDSLSKKYRNIGNEYFRRREYFDALLFYNRSLCTAEIGSDTISIAYANRSAVYIKLNHFDLCLQNIQLVRDNNYPAEKMERLDRREEECKELMKTLKPSPDDDPFNYFKLSYPANPKNPQIVDCLEVRSDNKGKHVVATRDLKTGDIIAIEEPFCAGLNPGARLYRCSFCLKDQLMNFIPCPGCANGEIVSVSSSTKQIF